MPERRGKVTLRLLGILLLAVPFVPLREIFGEFSGARAMVSPLEWVLGLAIFGSVAWLLAMTVPQGAKRRLARLAEGALALPQPLLLAATFSLLAVLLLLTSWMAFSRQPLLVDAVVQLFQAKTFAAGSFVAPRPPLDAFFVTQHMVLEGRGWYSQYPPAHAALLAMGVLSGAAWAVPVLLTLGTALLLYLFTRRVYGVVTAKLASALLLLSPFFWFMGASFMNHVSTLFFIAVFLWALAEWEARDDARWLFGAAAALGAAFLCRPVTSVAIGLPFVPVVLGSAVRRRRRAPIVAGALGFLLVASLSLAYNRVTTGDPLLPGYVKLWGGSHGLGFHETPWGDVHTPWTGLGNELLDLSLLNVFLFEWPVPSLLPVGLFFALGWAEHAWDRRLLLAFLALPAAYFFYWHRDAFLGPRFLYCGVASLIPLTARAIVVGASRLRIGSFRVGGLFRPANTRTFAALLGVLCLGYSTGYAIPRRFQVYASGMPSAKLDVVREARQAGLDEGLVFVAESWGSRILAQLRGLGVPASLAERAYRATDHCQLDDLVKHARRAGWSESEVVRGVERLIAETRAIEQFDLNGDPTLRLRSGVRLSPRCLEEVGYDRQGYTLYTPQLPANRPGLDGPFVVARDLREANGELRALYPDRPAYLYRNGEFFPLP